MTKACISEPMTAHSAAAESSEQRLREPRPLVSVLIPCYNAENTIARAIASVLAQSYRAYEIIAIDDVSQDGTLEVLKDFEKKGILRLVSLRQNGGPAAARNTGLQVARGEFVAFLDADDEWAPEKLGRQVAVLAANPRISMVGCQLAVQNMDGTTEIVNDHRVPPTGPEAWKALLRYSYYVPTSMMTRVALLKEMGGFDPSLKGGEDDQDLCIRLALKGEIDLVSDVLGTMHQQAVSLSSRFGRREWTTVLPLIERHCRALRDRLTPAEVSGILGTRYSHIGRKVFPVAPIRGLRLISRAILLGYRPVENIVFLLIAPLRLLKHSTLFWKGTHLFGAVSRQRRPFLSSSER